MSQSKNAGTTCRTCYDQETFQLARQNKPHQIDKSFRPKYLGDTRPLDNLLIYKHESDALSSFLRMASAYKLPIYVIGRKWPAD
jgi:hypothetical protein